MSTASKLQKPARAEPFRGMLLVVLPRVLVINRNRNLKNRSFF
eukprot:COSAG02_NODE_23658_length_711_cov_2.550654_1_plen_42_part_10